MNRDNFSESHIRALQSGSKRDPGLIERTVFAFGLLDALCEVGLPFVFKGGTSLMLLLKHPRRLSTDIDIVVAPGTDIGRYLEKAAKVFPFLAREEQVRFGKNRIEKRHFKFTYLSPVRNSEFYILLDVLFEDHQYLRTVKRPISNDLLLPSDVSHEVEMPDVNCILGDKMTAFAPHTTGIPLGCDKDLEVVKQFYDVATLIEEVDTPGLVHGTFNRLVPIEAGYRGVEVDPDDVLSDIISTAHSIGSRGKIGSADYPFLLKGMKAFGGHVYGERFSAETAIQLAPQVMYFAECMRRGMPFVRPDAKNLSLTIAKPELRCFKVLRIVNPMAYAYVTQLDALLISIGGADAGNKPQRGYKHLKS